MASRQIVWLEDDIDGGEADETVEFSLDGTPYQIDLNHENAKRLREALGQFTPHARKIGSGGRQSLVGKRAGRSEETGAIRAWAMENGLQVSARGRISEAVKDAYHAAVG